MKRVALITGASSGIGREVCLKLSEKGYCVYAAARRTDIVHSIEADRPRARYVVGFMAKPAIVMKWLLPDKLLDYIMRAFAEMG